MLSITRIAELLAPFTTGVSEAQLEQVRTYNNLLLRWNQRINLTAIRDPEESITRNFGESLFLATFFDPAGKLLDIGSGAGFPGLAIKIVCPGLAVTLLEPNAKKRAFLKEAARACELELVEALGKRIEDLALGDAPANFDLVTMRAVGSPAQTLPAAAEMLKPGGRLCLWLGERQKQQVQNLNLPIEWTEPHLLPLSRERMILVGIRRSSSQAG